jgi:hypothetical protein
MKLLPLVLISFFTILQVAAQDTTTVINRDAYRMKLVIDKKTTYESEIKVTPYFVQENVLQIYPGEDLYLEADLDNGKIKSVKVVKENLHPERTISIGFSQVVEKKLHEMMMLKVVNPFKQDLTYKVKLLPFRSNAWMPTMALPVKGGNSSFETWPDIITSIVLSEWSLKEN